MGKALLDLTPAPSYADIAHWVANICRCGAYPAIAQSIQEAAAALHEARELRALFWKVFDAQKNSQTIPTGAVTGLLDTARRRNASIAVYPDGSMTSLTAWGAFPLLALRAINLTLNPPRHGVRACDRCGWFFIDASRGRRRRWCSMKTCGNQAKAERYRSAHP
jgi:predicted RNA-binding Zn ribbon-like protein